MEYCREILSDLADGKYLMVIPRQNSFLEEFTEEEQQKGELLIYHLDILAQAGFITCNYETTSDYYLLPSCPQLTWEGNDFLDAIENDTVWENTKSFAKSKGFEVAKLSFEVLKEIAVGQGKKMLGIE